MLITDSIYMYLICSLIKPSDLAVYKNVHVEKQQFQLNVRGGLCFDQISCFSVAFSLSASLTVPPTCKVAIVIVGASTNIVLVTCVVMMTVLLTLTVLTELLVRWRCL